MLLKSTFPQLLPAGASGGPPPLGWWPTQTNRAMAARSARTSSNEEDAEEGARSTDEEDKTTTPHRKQATLVAVNYHKKRTYRFWRVKHLSERDGTVQCSAGPEWYGCHGTFGTLASTWAPAVGRPTSAGCLAAREKKKLRKERSYSDRRLPIGFFTSNSKSYAASGSLSLVALETL